MCSTGKSRKKTRQGEQDKIHYREIKKNSIQGNPEQKNYWEIKKKFNLKNISERVSIGFSLIQIT